MARVEEVESELCKQGFGEMKKARFCLFKQTSSVKRILSLTETNQVSINTLFLQIELLLALVTWNFFRWCQCILMLLEPR